MSKIEKRVIINDSVERLFTYVPEIRQSPEIWPGLLEVREVHQLLGALRYATWLYKLNSLLEPPDIRLEYEADGCALTHQLHGLDLVITLSYQPDRLCSPRLALNGDCTYWSQN